MSEIPTRRDGKQRLLSRQMVPVRDEVRLATNVYLPESLEPAPAVVVRTPYGRHNPALTRIALLMSQAGYSVIIQDNRGRYQSEGEYEWWSEENDTYDTLAWIAEQEWASGDVALLGISISGYHNLLAATRPSPPGTRIKAMVTVMGAVDFHSLFYRNGALLLHWAIPWLVLMDQSNMGRTAWQQLPWDEILGQLPLKTALDSHRRGDVAFWRTLLSYPAYEDFWQGFDLTRRLAEVSVPTLHIAGWYDFMQGQSLAAYRGLADPPRAPQRLVIGSGDHRTLLGSFLQGNKPDATADGGIDLLPLVVSWLDRWLSGREEAEAEAGESDVLLHMPGVGWLGGDSYPPPATEIDWHLQSTGSANGAQGSGRLQPEPPMRLQRDTFTYDPHDPVPTLGGAVWPFELIGLVPGPREQTPIESREDVLFFTSDPLAEDLFIMGPVRLEMWAATSGVDTDFTAQLVDVGPAGIGTILQDGIIRMRFRASRSEPQLVVPHRPYRLEIDLQHTAHVFRAGHRIRIQISSSNFPQYDRNLNTAELFGDGQSLVATQTVFHGGEMPSRLRLPVLAREELEARRLDPEELAARTT